MHIDEEALQRFIHAEMDEEMDSMARRHLAECPDCRSRYEREIREEEEIHALLRTIDHAAPALTVKELYAVEDEAPARRRRRRPNLLLRVVAVLMLIVATGTAYRVPGSPLPGWVDSAVAQARDLAARVVAAFQREPSPAPADPLQVSPDSADTG